LIAQASATAVTRREILDAIYPAFTSGGANTDEIIAAATAAARPEILEMLEKLPARRYPSIREMWSDLPEMPIS
jgi:hypothetical protein